MPPPRYARLTRRQWVMGVGVGLMVATATALTVSRRTPPPPGVIAEPHREIDFDESATRHPGYVGPNACAPCHANQFADFQSTRHNLACCLPQSDAASAGFPQRTEVFATRDPALRFELSRHGGEFIQTAIRDTPAGEPRSSSRIAFVYGAGGTTDEVYFTWHGDRRAHV